MTTECSCANYSCSAWVVIRYLCVNKLALLLRWVVIRFRFVSVPPLRFCVSKPRGRSSTRTTRTA